ncbi:leucyl aminopeptidase [Achromobacter sp. AONIH1]|jgi:leucyl aminopeptidase|uniref:leucyl aminopeptidase n=1 Tax=unclassified Achromobacter TaxID=2626865 RepID=UPI000CCFEB17|nr:leucyl aminopeptidase [Achromobacter sp. AONIH1]AUT46846.1 leucyl aminopeptidase [Achromobacter sp. AONIH1]
MEFSTQTTASLHQIKTAALAVGVFADGVLSPAADLIDRAANGAVRAVAKTEFRGRAGATLTLRNLPGVTAQRVVLVGLGKQDEYSARAHAAAEQAFAQACVAAQLAEGVSTLVANPVADVPVIARARSAAIAAGAATYHYDASFGKPDRDARPKLKKIVQIVERADATQAQKGLREGAAIANGMSLTRDLGNLPGNICTPTYLGETAKRLAREFKSLKVEVLDKKQVEALGMGSFLSVARGSDEPLRFIVLRHAGKPAKKGAKAGDGPIVLVGKGITFDAGGISLKPAATMDEMKYDMGGAASVLGSFRALAELELPLDVVGLIPACENLPSGKANKPGDVVTSMSGQTIEILNTDAEGRLVLCDALTYAERFKPSTVIDIATLTGACVVALGHVNTGLFSKDDALAEALAAAGRQALDTAWRLPMDDAYQDQLKSNFADIANIGGPPAGAVTAACFLSRFTKAYRWAHLDIAGTAWKGGKDKGATGRPVPLLMQFLLDQA